MVNRVNFLGAHYDADSDYEFLAKHSARGTPEIVPLIVRFTFQRK